jgi:hypothetical protein
MATSKIAQGGAGVSPDLSLSRFSASCAYIRARSTSTESSKTAVSEWFIEAVSGFISGGQAPSNKNAPGSQNGQPII